MNLIQVYRQPEEFQERVNKEVFEELQQINGKIYKTLIINKLNKKYGVNGWQDTSINILIYDRFTKYLKSKYKFMNIQTFLNSEYYRKSVYLKSL